MPCYECNGYWICDPDGLEDPCMEVRAMTAPPEDLPPDTSQKGPGLAPPWREVGTYEAEEEETAEVWCRPGSQGCQVKILSPGTSPGQQGAPWYYAGFAELKEGSYNMLCRKQPKGPRCQVRLVKV